MPPFIYNGRYVKVGMGHAYKYELGQAVQASDTREAARHHLRAFSVQGMSAYRDRGEGLNKGRL